MKKFSIILALVVIQHLSCFLMGSEMFDLSIGTTLQSTSESNGVTTVRPLILVPCDVDSKPRILPLKANPPHASKSKADFFLILKNISSHPKILTLRDPWKIKIILHTEDSSPKGGGNHPKDFSYMMQTPPSEPFQFGYTLGPGSVRIEKVNLFDIPEMKEKPLDWYVSMEISKIKIDYYVVVEESGIQCVSTGWVAIEAKSLP